MVDQANYGVVFLQEMKLSGEDSAFFSKKLSSWHCMLVDVDGASSGLGVLWKEALVCVSLVDSGSYW